LLVDGNVGVGVFPEGEKVFVRRQRAHSCRIGIDARGIFLLATHTPNCASAPVEHQAAVVEDLLEFGGGFVAIVFGDAVANQREATTIVFQARCRLTTRSEVLEVLAGGTI